MKKTIYIHKGQFCKFDDLTCEQIVINGALKVTGALTAKYIQGSGVISANEIRCISLVTGVVYSEKIVCNELMARHVSATEVHAASSLSVSTFIEAGYVKTPKAIIAEAEVEDMRAAEIIELSPKARSLWGMLIISQLRTWWVNLICSGKKFLDKVVENSRLTETENAEKSVSGTAQESEIADDPEFQTFVTLFNAYKRGDLVVPQMGRVSSNPEKPHQLTVVKSGTSEDAA